MGSIVQHSSWYRPALSLAPSSNATQTHTDHFSCLSTSRVFAACQASARPGAKGDKRRGRIQLSLQMLNVQKQIQGTTLGERVHSAHVTPAYGKHPVERHSVVVG